MDASVSENERTTSTPVASYRSATATVSLGNRHSRNSVSVPLSILKEHLTCPLCQGYFRDPYTIVECLHSFCKSCLVYTFSQGFHRCPTCRSTELHPDPYRRILSDRSLQDFVSRTFPDLDRVDDNEEEKFYLSRGISRDIRTIGEERTAIEKVENDETARHVQETDDEDSDETRDSCRYMMKRKAKSLSKLNEVASPPSHSKRRRAPHLFLDETDRQSEQRLTSEGKVKHLVYRDSAMENSKNCMDELNVIFTPDDNVKFPQYRMPQLQLPLLRTSGKLKVMQLRKYLKLKLGIEAAADDKVEILCNGDPLGDELSLTFIRRTRWLQEPEDLVLTFRWKESTRF